MKISRFSLAGLLVFCLCAALASAQSKDVAGSKDSPFVSRYPGSVIDRYATHQFDEYEFPVGAVTSKGQPKLQPVEGKVTRIVYKNPAGRSALEIDRNYESALRGAGFEPIFVCKADACGISRFHATADWADLWYGDGHFQFSGKVSRPQGDIYVNLHVTQDETDLDFVETKAMESGLVVAASLKSDLGKSGHAAVYGIHFDTGKADVKQDSAPAMAEIVKLFGLDPALKLYVVGHTDNVGAMSANIDLSMRRALAVVQARTTQYGLPLNRLQAAGDGPTAPVASNDTEAGRALNRRVELVKQ